MIWIWEQHRLYLIKVLFPNICGFRNTLLQPINNGQVLQVIDVILGHTNHWIVMSAVGCGDSEVDLYDSLQYSPSVETQTVIAKYFRSQSKSVEIKVINVAIHWKATVIVSCMPLLWWLKKDSVNVVYSQADLRIHQWQCFEKGFLKKFQISKKTQIKEDQDAMSDIM